MEKVTLDRRQFVKLLGTAGVVSAGTWLFGCTSEPKVTQETPEETKTVEKVDTVPMDDKKTEEFVQTVTDIYDNIIEACKPENLKETGGKALDKVTDGFIYFVDLMNGETTIGGHTIQELKSEAALGCSMVIKKAEEQVNWAYDYVKTEIDENYPELWETIEQKKNVVKEDAGKLKDKFDNSKDKSIDSVKEKIEPETVEAIEETVESVKANGAEVFGYVQLGVDKGSDWVKENGPSAWSEVKERASDGWNFISDKAGEFKEQRSKEK